MKMTQLLLEKGATINTFDKKDRRAVHWAAYMGHVDIVRLLVSFGAELGCRDKQVRSSTELCLHSFLCNEQFHCKAVRLRHSGRKFLLQIFTTNLIYQNGDS